MLSDVSARKAGFDTDRLNRITDHLQQNYIEPGKIAGAQVVVARGGQVAYHECLGLRDRERNKAMEPDTIFRIYSMTKPITSIALMQLYERGMFQLDDSVYRHLPQWREQQVYVSGDGDSLATRAAAQPMTFRHLLTHTAGLTYGASDHPVDKAYKALRIRRDAEEDLQKFVDKLAKVPLYYSPGERWLYSYATDVCGYLVEALSGQSLDEYFAEHIFEPLGMTDTGFSVAPESVDRFAANYQRAPDKSLRLLDDPEHSAYLAKPVFLSGGGGLTGTAEDYLHFCEMLRQRGSFAGRRLIGSRTLELMHRNHLAGDLAGLAVGAFSETAYEGVGFGLGFATSLDPVATGSLGAGDYYWGGAASTIFWVDPIEDLVVIFMTQLMPSATFNFRGQLKNIIYSALED